SMAPIDFSLAKLACQKLTRQLGELVGYRDWSIRAVTTLMRSERAPSSCGDQKSNTFKCHITGHLMSLVILGLVLILVLGKLFSASERLLLRPLQARFSALQLPPTDQVVGIAFLGGFHLDSHVSKALKSDVAGGQFDLRCRLS